MDIIEHNKGNWNDKVAKQNQWTVPVGREEIKRAREGEWTIVVTTEKPVPHEWFPELKGKRVLCLASGGGQQGPILAAAGAEVTVLDFSEEQLKQDAFVAERDGLTIHTVLGSMTDLGMFDDATFDLIVHPVSNVFIPDIQPVWEEAYRVLKPGGTLISGFMNPVFYLFDWKLQEQGILQVNHKLPYSDLDYASEQEIAESGDALEFGHTLEQQIQGQIRAGFMIAGFYEDTFGGTRLLDRYCSSFIATRAIKP
ncbi:MULTISPECIES: class I SAM-dependent methyltransferase [unclassified Paenibacillus]|uniref:class I SAM-dependent methyltransferase n=1 Tax=unclassified Paenibacillus TaxID=185978 RepID=UPI001C10A00C|nr:MULTISPECIES: class I SAM-dependent methyltransferase [unclassified Paenibacillus]MBU5443104.1 methyltransferase domain-containing protein [Paenibacillus sp. MSJ-34]CAH0122277.1 2-methoxy-6-polyprenyl-1,4-benzoquinol methylase, mitochondrial [Paenibacillus sp. CECT 9249]